MQAVRMVMVAAALFAAAPAAAQQGQGGQGRPGMDPAAMQQRQNEMLFRGITLTDAQRARVDSIQTAARARQQAAMQGGGGMRDPETRERMRAQRMETMTAIRAVLTPEQQAQFDRNLSEMPGMQGGGRPPEGARPPRR